MIRRLAAISAAALAVLFCSDRHETGTLATKPEPPRSVRKALRVNVNSSLKSAGLVIAKEEGFFEQEGIDAELVVLDANSALLAATSGKLDVLSTPVRAAMFNAMLRGVDFQVVADKGHSAPGPCTPEAFTAPVELANRILASDDNLRGQQIAIIRGGVTEYLVDQFLAQRHLSRSDVQLVHIPPGDWASSTRQETLAIRYMQEPALSNALSKGSVKILATGEDVAPGHQHDLIIFGKRLLRDDPDLGRRFLRAYLRGVQRYQEGKTPRNVEILSRHTQLPSDLIRQTCWPAFAKDGRIRPERVQEILDWARKNGYMEAEVPIAKWWNPSFVEAANRTLTAEAQ